MGKSNHRLERGFGQSLRNWEKLRGPATRGMTSDAFVEMGWGRLVFGHTFEDNERIVETMTQYGYDRRDIAMYIIDPHVVISLAPDKLFLDPSHTFRLWSHDYTMDSRTRNPFVIQRVSTRREAREINRIYGACHMKGADPDFILDKRANKLRTYMIAKDLTHDRVIGTVTGVDHVAAFNDPEKGASLWSLAVDPQCDFPGVGSSLVRHLCEHYFTRGRAFVDISVMHDNKKAIALYEKLGCQRIPVFCIKRKNPINQDLYTASQQYAGLNPYARLIVDEARKRGIRIDIDESYLIHQLKQLLSIPSPSGYSDQVVHYVGSQLEALGIEFEVTRRGPIRATLPGKQNTLDRAVTVHLDTLGAMVSRLKDNGKLAVTPIGSWSSRFAEGGRVTVFTQSGPRRGTVLPLKASGHAWGDAVDALPVSWDHVELRVDEICRSKQDLAETGFDVGDTIAFDALPEITENGFINARHLDDKAGAAIVLSAAKALTDSSAALPVDCHLIFTIFEEIGFGASADVYADVSEMVVVDLAPVSPDQNASEYGVTIAMKDQTGPFDYHLSRKLVNLCRDCDIDFQKDVFRYYRSDAASAIEAGHDVRTALVGFGVDASHGYERTHLSSLTGTARLMVEYIQSGPTFKQDPKRWASLKEFPHQPDREIIRIKT